MRALLALAAVLTPALALAQSADGAPLGAGSPYASLLPLVLIFFVFYFLLIKPQQKRLKDHQLLIGSLKKGDEIVTGGGFIGRITKAGEGDTVVVEISKGVEVIVVKSTITGLVSAQKPVPDAKKKAAKGSVKNDNAVPSRDSVANDN